MFVLYNIVQLVLLAVFLPFIILFILFSSKYRDRIPCRLGLGLADKVALSKTSDNGASRQTVWLHALSVGEVTSAVPLVAGLRKAYPQSRIIVSVSTRTGKHLADKLLQLSADHIIDSPLDILPVVALFAKHIQPDLFILVETDFWPNTLLFLKGKKVPTILVNGRISEKSMNGYRRLRGFFVPMFQSFSFLCMQTERDREKMKELGLPPKKLLTLGNLKFDTIAGHRPRSESPSPADVLPKNRILFICGSTHPGEEKILIDCYIRLRKKHPEVFLIIAPRDPVRAAEIESLAAAQGLTATLRSGNGAGEADLFILDTIGELIDFYALSHIAFVGGSLIRQGGHNPIEPAIMGIPIIFGPNMQDFSEIADILQKAGGATQIAGSSDLGELLDRLLASQDLRATQGLAARQCIEKQRGVIEKHLELISRIL